MAFQLLTKIFGSRNDRLLRSYRKTVERINQLEQQYASLDDAQLRAQTDIFKKRLADGASLEDILPEAFATVREASKRVMKMRHFDVQMLGGLALHNGKVAEMRTGEGKTLTATLPVYLNALTGEGVHVVTVNDYLAERDAQWMSVLYNFLGMTVGINLPNLDRAQKQAAYQADITYGTNNEFGFDYLRDNMVYDTAERVQRRLNYAIVDEVDSILIDEARTPLIISGQAEDHTAMYVAINAIIPKLTKQEGEEDIRTGEGVITPGDFTVDEKGRQVHLTEAGHDHAEQAMVEMGLLAAGASLYDASNIMLMHHLNAALRAHHLYIRDQHYVVQNGEIVIVDEFTGRLMSGRRWSEGLHQAVEAKEGVAIQAENQTMASITFQNYFRLYKKLSGMTGTADTEAYEFQEIYGLETVVVPPNRLNRRDDQLDRVYKTTGEKYVAAIQDIKECYERGQPVLVGTSSIDNSEIISQLLTQAGLPHEVLNAKQHAREADIIVQAGRLKAITIATNMAGRGTDIVLGGNLEKLVAAATSEDALSDDERRQREQAVREAWQLEHDAVVALGGLRIIATERHESRRIDNQLRGRSGRQGDPGSSRFYLSLEDSLLRIFAGDRVRAIMDRLKMPEGEAIEAGMVTRSIESAQRKVEARNFDIRKQLLEYDDVANDQRRVIYQQRNDILEAEGFIDQITSLRHGAVEDLVRTYVPVGSVEEQWDLQALQTQLAADWAIQVDLAGHVAQSEAIDDDDLVQLVIEQADAVFNDKLSRVGEDNLMQFARMVLLQVLDSHWRDHLSALDYLRQGIHLRGYAQKQPKQEYKREAFELFGRMLDGVRDEVTRIMLTVRVDEPDAVAEATDQMEQQANHVSQMTYSGPDEQGNAQVTGEPSVSHEAGIPRVGRNEPCPCGSGKKYKQCHGKL
jgi:preprotein translocase subunit SecA